MGEGVLDNVYFSRGRRRNNRSIYLSVYVHFYCATLFRNFLKLSDIYIAQYDHLNELKSSRIEDAYPFLHQGNNVNAIVGGFFNQPLLENVAHIPHVAVLTN